MGVWAKIAGTWQEIAAPTNPGIPWAKVSGGTVTTVNNPDGSVDEVHTFTADGTLTVESPGYARVLLVGGGGGGSTNQYGNGGRVLSGVHALTAGANPVVVGAGGNNVGGPSSIGALATGRADLGASAANVNGAGSTLTDAHAGFTSDITGASVVYAKSGGDIGSIGGGGWNGFGTAGIVIVRVQKSAPTVSGVVATGGTISEYTGDGVNGVLGQKYRVHTFTAAGSLVVTQGGECDLFMISGGSGAMSASHSGGGGSPWAGRVTLAPGVIPVVVGEGGQAGVSWNAWACPGKPSSLGGLETSIGEASFGAGATSANPQAAMSSSISGTSQTYGLASAASTRPNRGDGSSPQAPGSAGVVIVRYEIATP